jgi:hypothetical protein
MLLPKVPALTCFCRPFRIGTLAYHHNLIPPCWSLPKGYHRLSKNGNETGSAALGVIDGLKENNYRLNGMPTMFKQKVLRTIR